MHVIGEPPHPQALFAGFAPDDPAFEAMARLVATARTLDEGMDVSGLRIVEWDVLVARETDVRLPGHLHLLAMGCLTAGMVQTATGASAVHYEGSQPSAQMAVAQDLPDRLRRLVVGELVPWLQRQPRRPFLTTYEGMSRVGSAGGSFGEGAARAFVRDADGNMIAGEFERGNNGYGGGLCWVLPFVPERPELWLAAALDAWRIRTPQRIPALPGWRTRAAWQTKAERDAVAAVARLHEERSGLLTVLSERERLLEARAGSATIAADEGRRLLLTGQGPKLVHAVATSLTSLGFRVTDADSDLPEGTAKTEDLRVADEDAPDWSNITEVRGYTAGGKTNDLQRLARFASTFQLRTGAVPTSRWYIVNQFLEQDPDSRQTLLAGADEDIETFAEDGGLVIDTRQLFDLISRVEDGLLDAAEARATLRGCVGRLVLPHPPDLHL
jgi:hypothetical protein